MVVTSAPGKVLLFGEYAVLSGCPALVAAVQRRATCRVLPASGVEVEGLGLGTTHWPPRPGDAPLPFALALLALTRPAPGRYVLDSSALSVAAGGAKLGLGSSAATTVALAAALTEGAGPRALYQLAQAAHRQAQGTGSGADVAAAATGGVIRYQWQGGSEATFERVPAGRTRLHVVWTGQPASTTALVGRVEGWAASAPARHRDLVSALGDAALQAFETWAEFGDLRPAAAASITALEALGAAAGVAIVTDLHRRLDADALAFGCRVKPTGAGGGDLAWIVGVDAEAEGAAAVHFAAAGRPVLALPVDPEGAVRAGSELASPTADRPTSGKR